MRLMSSGESLRIFQLHHAHVRKDTWFSPLFCTASDGKLGGAWIRGYQKVERGLGTRLSERGCLTGHPGQSTDSSRLKTWI